MTREEAIELLQHTSFFGRSMDDIDTAIDMAIKALEQEPIKGYCKTCFYFGDTYIDKKYIDPHDANMLRGDCFYHNDEYYHSTNEECYCSHWLKKRG